MENLMKKLKNLNLILSLIKPLQEKLDKIYLKRSPKVLIYLFSDLVIKVYHKYPKVLPPEDPEDPPEIPETEIVEEMLGFARVDLQYLVQGVGAINQLSKKFPIFEYPEGVLQNPEIWWSLRQQEQNPSESLKKTLETLKKEKYEPKVEEPEEKQSSKKERGGRKKNLGRAKPAGRKKNTNKKQDKEEEVVVENLEFEEDDRWFVTYFNDPLGEKEDPFEEEDVREFEYLVSGPKLLALEITIV